RRRHTRSKRDWSSDVCSSDLTCLDEDAAPCRELRALDPPERHLEETVTVIGVRLQGNALPARLPRPEHAGPTAGAADVRLTNEDVVTVVHCLQQAAESPVGVPVGNVRDLLHDA